MKNLIRFPLMRIVSNQQPLLALFLVAIVSSIGNADDGPALFDPMDVFDLEWATDPRVSPDERNIVYVRQSNDIMKDRQRSNLWQVSSNGKDHRPLSTRLSNASSPRWSPDNKRLAFI